MIPFAHALLRDNADVLVAAPCSAGQMVAAAGLDHHAIPDPPAEILPSLALARVA